MIPYKNIIESSYNAYEWLKENLSHLYEEEEPKKVKESKKVEEPKKVDNDFKDIFDPVDSRLYDPMMVSLLDSLVQEVQMGNVPILHQFIGDLESNNILTAENPISNASGIYQFVPEEVKTTKRRAIRNVGFDPEYIKAIPNDPTLWSQEQSDIMLMSRLFPMEEEGKPFYMDKLLRRAYRQDWDIDDFLEVYDKHHTLVDKSQYGKEIDLNKKRIIKKYLNL